ncbi:hypothetical protein BLA60_07355 [Actinophytocola xinjiangensis]|uniref:Uncharacterized protein n=1 Tax=Actinophytocola xinjiangensis TaxID=485602 RepID=A0A7Z0WQG7_9PSEU|nr:hypothetical protein [Actinophytocola xinjiangensis]OLF13048.1 hypothetical protein BLA60_07355 [Actinophytocola xinjiangensis]
MCALGQGRALPQSRVVERPVTDQLSPAPRPTGYGADVHGYTARDRRLVAAALLVAVLAVFGMGTSANAQTPEDPSHGAVVLAVATPPASGLAHSPGPPDLPLADAAPPPARDQVPSVTATGTAEDEQATSRAHLRTAGDRAPPA